MKKKKLKKYKLKVDGIQDPMNLISLVFDPAIEQKGFYFSKVNDSKNINFKFNNDKNFEFKFNEFEGILVAPVMIPDLEIYRYNEVTDEEYIVEFDKETIQLISEKFNENYNGKRINFEHSDIMTDGVIVESWIKEDEEFDKSKKYGFDLTIGTWFIKIKFNNKDWFKKYVVEKEYSGLSIELIESFMEFDKVVEFEFSNQIKVIDNNQNFDNMSDIDIENYIKELFNLDLTDEELYQKIKDIIK